MRASGQLQSRRCGARPAQRQQISASCAETLLLLLPRRSQERKRMCVCGTWQWKKQGSEGESKNQNLCGCSVREAFVSVFHESGQERRAVQLYYRALSLSPATFRCMSCRFAALASLFQFRSRFCLFQNFDPFFSLGPLLGLLRQQKAGLKIEDKRPVLPHTKRCCGVCCFSPASFFLSSLSPLLRG